FTYHLPNLLRADALCLSPKDRRVLLRVFLYFLMAPRPPKSTLFPYTTLFRSPQNQILKLQFHYRGSVIKDAGNGVLFVGARESWYPHLGDPSDFATYDLIIRWPRRLRLVATGLKLDEHEEGEFRVGHWRTEKPVAVAGFNLG